MSFPWVRRPSAIMLSICTGLICRFNAMPTWIPASLFVEIDRLILKFLWKCLGPRIYKLTLKRSRSGGLILQDFKVYYKVTVIKIMWYGGKDRQTYQWNRTEPQDRSTHVCATDFNKSRKAVQWRRVSSLTNGIGTVGYCEP